MLRLNLTGIDLLTVRLVVAALQRGSLTAAASEVHLALAAASRRVRDLEAALGARLFERHARGLSPTAAGSAFLRHGLAILQSLDGLSDDLADLRLGVSRHVRLAAGTAAINQFLPSILARYARECPHVRVELEEQVSEQVVAAVRNGRADIGIFVEGPDTGDLSPRLFREDELVLVLAPDHPCAADRGPVAFPELLDQDWIGLNTGAAVLERQRQAAAGAGRSLRIRIQVRSFDAACRMVSANLGIAVLPRLATQPIVRAMRLVTRPLTDPWAKRRLMLAIRPGCTDDTVGRLADFLLLPEPSQNAKARRRKRQWTQTA